MKQHPFTREIAASLKKGDAINIDIDGLGFLRGTIVNLNKDKDGLYKVIVKCIKDLEHLFEEKNGLLYYRGKAAFVAT